MRGIFVRAFAVMSRNFWGRGRCCLNRVGTKGTTLLELIVVMAVFALVLAILMPALRKGRRNADAVRTMNNQRIIVIAVTSYASENAGRYPPSVATIGQASGNWNWQEPTMLTSFKRLDGQTHRSVSAYLGVYIEDAKAMFCPSAPEKYKYLQQSWDAGDEWDNPETPQEQDPVFGTYCLYWNYIGCLDNNKIFKGPGTPSSLEGESKLLVSDYFGFGHWRNRFAHNDYRALGSCEKMKDSSITPGTWVSSAYWSRWVGDEIVDFNDLDIELHGGFTDGHIETYSASEVAAMRVAQDAAGREPYPDDMGPGVFYLPKAALR